MKETKENPQESRSPCQESNLGPQPLRWGNLRFMQYLHINPMTSFTILQGAENCVYNNLNSKLRV